MNEAPDPLAALKAHYRRLRQSLRTPDLVENH